MGGLMNRYYYGKAGQADFTVDKMPATRSQLFFATLKNRLGGMVGVNLLMCLFALPLLVWAVMNISVAVSATEDFVTAVDPIDTKIIEYQSEYDDACAEYDKYAEGEAPEEVLAAYEEKNARMVEYYNEKNEITENYKTDLRSYLFAFLLVAVPCLMIIGIGKPGQMYVLRNWARDDHAFVMSDFKDAIKGNWKYGLLTGFIDGFSLLMAYICFTWYGGMAAEKSAFFTIPQVLIVMLAIIWWMIRMVIYPMMVTYDSKYKQLVQNSLLMVLARLPFTVLIGLATLIVPAIILALAIFWNFTYALLAALAWVALLGFSLPGLLHASYANSLFDKYLNPRIEGAEVNKGLRPAGLDDEDEGEEILLDGRTKAEAERDNR